MSTPRTSRAPSNFPPRDGEPWIGRDADVAAIHAALAGGSRLVTILGAGGIGKTRLAARIALAAREREELSGGVWLCDAQHARTADDLAAVVAKVLGIATSTSVIEAVAQNLATRPPTLLVIDNFEQVAEFAGETVGRWLSAASDLSCIVTSREPLAIAGESRHVLGPLDDTSGVELFIEQARRTAPDVKIVGEDVDTIRRIVRLVDGIPLAIDMVAARVAVLPLTEIETRLTTVLDIPGTRRDAPSRHKTMRAAVDWSYELLDPAEKQMLTMLGVFRGTFDLRAAEAVLPNEGDQPTADRIDALVSKSLVARTKSTSGRTIRMRLLAPIRAFAEEKLAATATDGLLARHAEWYLKLSAEVKTAVESSDAAAGLAAFDADLENFRGAQTYFARAQRWQDVLTLMHHLEVCFVTRGPLAVHRNAVEQALSAGGDSIPESLRALSLADLAETIRVTQGSDECVKLAQQAIELGEKTGTIAAVAHARVQMASYMWQSGRPLEGRELAIETIEIARPAGLDFIEILALVIRGVVCVTDRQLDEARACVERARAITGHEGRWLREPSLRFIVADIAGTEGRIADTIEELERAAESARALGDRRIEASATYQVGIARREMGDLDAAEACLVAARRAFRDLGSWAEADAEWQLATLRAQRADLRSAADGLARAAAVAGARGVKHTQAVAAAASAVVRGLRGDARGARPEVDRALRMLGETESTTSYVTFEILRAMLTCLEGHAMIAAGAREDGVALRESGRATVRAAIARSGHRTGDPMLWGARVWATALLDDLGVPLTPGERIRLEIGPNVEWFAVGEGEPVDMKARHILRKLLRTLIDRRAENAEDAVSTDDLVEAAWPGTTEIDRTVLNKLYVSVTTLRKLGLGDILESSEGGYRIRADVDVRRRS